ncbi:hypothetical protein [Arthrobacter sp. Soil762]|uniref:hypothetical protein n=1 Tax=Arthrobacter sp. Soil762 TaxID=1736401 RepID=UPI0007007F74|nr:hypothetical protein [Arthrobacter sp. Soil762]KRE69047.1 hypothetical protein ASG77_16765 [Arthrobacter sp. Soil762]
MQTAYEAAGSADFFLRLASAWHARVMAEAVACFDQALADVGLADDDPVRKVLHNYFTWAATTTVSRYQRSAEDVPDGLRIPRWSWDGLVGETGSGSADSRPAAKGP